MTETAGLTAGPVTIDNVGQACRIAVRPDQERFVAPVAWSLAEAYVNQQTAWPRLILRGEDAVGFVMAAFDPDSEIDFFRCGIWRLNVSAEAQRAGVGRFAVKLVLDEARRRGFTRASVLWEPGDGGPAGFYEHLGFVPTGQIFQGEVVAMIPLR